MRITEACLVAAALSLDPWRASAQPDRPSTAGGIRIDGRAQGTTYRIRAAGPPRGALAPSPAEIERRVAAELDRVDRLVSAWRDDSEIERFGASPAGVGFALSPETAELLARSREIWRLTEGAFDPTIGALTRLWGFAGAPRRTDLPAASDIAKALGDAGFDHLALDGRTISRDRSGLRIDLNGIAQGYTVDRVFGLLRAAGYTRTLVEIGGEVRVGDAPAEARAWGVGIDLPDLGTAGTARATLSLTHAAVSTSGTHRNGFEVGGVRYSHILDPRDGWPIRNGMLLATVVAPDATLADALSTALLVLGPERALALVENLPGVDCLLLARQDGAVREFRSRGLSRWIEPR